LICIKEESLGVIDYKMMKATTMFVLAAFLCATPVAAKDDPQAVARCLKLADLAEDNAVICSGMGCNDSSIVMGARVDCEKGQYVRAIAALEKYLRAQHVTIPPN